MSLSEQCGFRANCPRCDYETVLFEDDVTRVDVDDEDRSKLWSQRNCPECVVGKGDVVVDSVRLEVTDAPG